MMWTICPSQTRFLFAGSSVQVVTLGGEALKKGMLMPCPSTLSVKYSPSTGEPEARILKGETTVEVATTAVVVVDTVWVSVSVSVETAVEVAIAVIVDD
jgi:hypothetical protein